MLKVWREVKRVCAVAGFKFLDKSDLRYAAKLFSMGLTAHDIAERVLDSIYGLDKMYDC